MVGRLFAFLFLSLILAGCAGSGQAPARVVANGDTVTVDYVGALDNGTVFDSSVTQGRAPLTFVVGMGKVIRGFDSAVLGMKEGETKSVRIEAKDAYGAWSADNVISVPLANIHGTIAVGTQLEGDNGMTGTVVEVGTDAVKMDFNSPLAGKALNFKITVNNITKAAAN